MKLKLSTSAALALGSIFKNAGADSKAVLADKVAASYEKQFNIHDEDLKKRIFQHTRELQARLRKNVANLGGRVSATNTISGVAGARKHPDVDVGILGARELRPDQPNLHNRKSFRDSPLAHAIKKFSSPDIGILGKSQARQHRSSIIANKLRLSQRQSVEDSTVEGDLSDNYYGISYWEPKPYLCEATDANNTTMDTQSVNNYNGTFLYDLPMPTCSCKDDQFSDNCGPDLCNCLENAQGDITSCMDEVNTLCEGNVSANSNNNGTDIFTTQTLSMDQCTGDEFSSASYCTMIPCVLDGRSYEQCMCNTMDHICNNTNDQYYSALTCTVSTCCQGQTDDAGRLSCLTEAIGDYFYTSYGSNETSPSFVTDDDDSFTYMYDDSFITDYIADYNECIASSSTSSAAECLLCIFAENYCESYSEFCGVQTCCQSETDAAATVDCFTSAFYEECINYGDSKYSCLCQQSYVGCTLAEDVTQCEVYECCYSSDGGDGQIIKACLGLGDENQPSPAITVAPTYPVSITNTNPIHANNPYNHAGAGGYAKAGKVGAKASKAKAGKSKTKSSKQNSPAVTAPAPFKPAPLVNPIHVNKPTGTGFHAKASKAGYITSKASKSKSSKKANFKQKIPAVPTIAVPIHPAPLVYPIHAKYPVKASKSSKNSKASKSKSSKTY